MRKISIQALIENHRGAERLIDAIGVALGGLFPASPGVRMPPYAQIGERTSRTGPLYTDDAIAVRRIGYAIHRYYTKADPKQVGARYILEFFGEDGFNLLPDGVMLEGKCDHGDWTWYRGTEDYENIYQVLKEAALPRRDSIYVDVDPNRVADEGPHYAKLSQYQTQHGINFATACASIVKHLVQRGVLEPLDDLPGHGFIMDLEALDAWVAAALIQLEGR